MTENVYWILKAQVQEGNADKVRQLAAKFCDQTQQEAGTIAYEWALSEDDSVLHIYERFANAEAALAHIANVGDDLPHLLALISLDGIECYGAHDDAFRKAVAELPMTYMNTFAGFHR